MEQSFESIQDRMGLLSRDIDNHLEEKYGTLYPLHPMRLPRGKAANPSADGLFATTITFDLGYGSKTGRGYLVRLDVRTLEKVSPEDRKMLSDDVYDYLIARLPEVFPERKLMAVEDNGNLKIVGDFTVHHQI